MSYFRYTLPALIAALLIGCAPAPATPSPTPTTVPAATATPVPTLAPTSTPAPTATATPRPTPRFEQMTQGGCCVQPSYSPDGARILYLDKPRPDAPVGIYAVPAASPLAPPTLAFKQIGPFSSDMTLAVDLVNGQTVVERIADGKKWTVPNGGRRVSFSPDSRRMVWAIGEDVGNFDVRRSDIYVANADGTGAKLVATRYGGGPQGWLPDSERLLISGKVGRGDAKAKLSVLSLADGRLTDLLETERARGLTISPDGRWGVSLIAQAQKESDNGVFLISLEGATAPARLGFFGAYQWCDATRLLYIPLAPGSASNELWKLDVGTMQTERLVAASADSSFRIANGDWDVSPDGRRIVFLSAIDRNIWQVTLPAPCGSAG